MILNRLLRAAPHHIEVQTMCRRSPRRKAFTLVELPAVSERKRVAFTLVELLVVIGIIALLIAILMPALSKARDQANMIKCMSNMRQIGTAYLMHASEHRNH